MHLYLRGESIVIKEPKVSKREHQISLHGSTWADEWFWLRERDDPETIPYIEAENAYTQEMLKDVEGTREELYREMRGRIKERDENVPVKDGPFYYYTRFEEGGQYPIYCRKRLSLEAEEEIILDVNALAEGLDYLQIGVCRNSPDHRFLVYSTDADGAEEYVLHIKDMESGRVLDEKIEQTYYSLAWSGDSCTFFYSKLNEFHRPVKVYRHRIGEDPARDTLIYEEKDARFFVDVQRSPSGRFIYVQTNGNNMDEWWFLRDDDAVSPLQLIEARRADFEYEVSDHEDHFLIHHNGDGAKDFKVSQTPLEAPSQANWVDFIAHEPGRLIQAILPFADYLVVSERRNGLPVIQVKEFAGGQLHQIVFEEQAYAAWPSQGREWHTKTLRFSYMSMKTPDTIYDYDMESRQRVQRKQREVLGGFEQADYETQRLFATARDGVEVPISLVYRKGTPLDGSSALLLYAYGSYGACTEATFQQEHISLLDRGVIWATAHIRGGMEMGRDWYEEGKLLKKKNSFTDFIDCAEFLIGKDYTQADRLVARGGSAGGLLMGAVTNMRPDLFHGVIAQVPFVDVLNTMLDDSLPLTTMEYNEWGNPQEREFYEYIRWYSPYDNTIATDYPHMLITGGLNDPRVTYWEPTKWIAKLRDVRTNDRLLLLDMKMGAGHGGVSGRFEHLKDTALEWAFVLKILGKLDAAS
jgi:oligopeptidase B